jgi:hypothetical protein
MPDRKQVLQFVKEQIRRPYVYFYANAIDTDPPESNELEDLDRTATYIHIHFSHPLDLTEKHALEVVKEAIKLHMIYSVSLYSKQIDILLH